MIRLCSCAISGGSTTFHRADLQQTLVSGLNGRLHLGHRFSSYEEVGDEIRIQFQNGTTATCDLLVGMDGIKSAVRKSLLLHQGLPDSPSMEPVWSGTIAYRGLVPRDVLDEVFPGHRAITTPMMVSLVNDAGIFLFPLTNAPQYVGKFKVFQFLLIKNTSTMTNLTLARRRLRHLAQLHKCCRIRHRPCQTWDPI